MIATASTLNRAGMLLASGLAMTSNGSAQTPSGSDPSATTHDVFACAFVASESDEPGSIVDLRAERTTNGQTETWRLDWADGRSADGVAFDAKFGSVGGSTGVQWSDARGRTKKAFISYSDMVLPEGQRAMFLSLDKPSLWQPPGYVCQTAALKENRP